MSASKPGGSPPPMGRGAAGVPAELAEELLTPDADSAGEVPDGKHTRGYVAVVLQWCLAVVFVALCVASRTGHVELDISWVLPGLALAWVASFVIATKSGGWAPAGGASVRWLCVALAILVPLAGQIVAVVLARTLSPRGPLRLAFWGALVGWSAMVLAALYAVDPLFVSAVHGAGGAAAAQPVLIDLALSDYYAPLHSILFVYGSAGLLPLVCLLATVGWWRRQGRRAAQTQQALQGVGMLTVGEAVVRGTVELAQGHEHAVRVVVEQEGTERADSHGAFTHRWTEKSRQVLAEPFYLRHASGERVRVEPDDEVYLWDELDETIVLSRSRRQRQAALTPGEHVTATGRLARRLDPEAGGQYRGSQGWVLGPLAQGRMLLSTQPLHSPFERTAKRSGRVALALGALLVVGQLLFVPFHLRLWAATLVEATVVSHRETTTTDDDGHDTRHHLVTVAAPDRGYRAEVELPYALSVQVVKGCRVPVRLVAPVSFSLPGRWPRANEALCIIFVILCAIAATVALFVAPDSAKAWHQKKLNEKGSGPLPPNP